MDYFIWLGGKDFNFVNAYKGMYYTLIALFFPILSYFDINKLFNLEGELYVMPLALKQDKGKITRKMQSKLFWYYTFKENDINTPKVYYYKDKNKNYLINSIDTKNFILKPEYGTEGVNIKKATLDEFIKIESRSSLLLQEYVKDCFYPNARHFRIITAIDDKCYLFSLDERKQINDKIASNHANGAALTMCNENCDFLSDIEQNYIDEIIQKLVPLHEIEFHAIPFIGWDVCLTCNGPYVFEGNLGSAIPDEKMDEYMKMINKLYSAKPFL